VIVISSGSEVSLCVAAVQAANSRGRRVRLVSMPSVDAFERQPPGWRDNVLPPAVTRRLAVEAGATQSWWKYVGLQGQVLGIDHFGASGKAADLFKHFGLTSEAVTKAVDQLLAG
jgi:transketolase